MDRALVEYAVNAAWQLPVLAAGAWLLVRVTRPSAAAQYRIWVGVLMLVVVLPLAGVLADSGTGRGASEGLGQQTGAGLAAMRVVPAHDAVAGVRAGTQARATGAARGAAQGVEPGPGVGALDAGDSGQIGEPSGLVLGSLGAGHGSSWTGWGVAAMEHVRRIELSATAAEWIAGVYLLVMLLGLVRIVRAWSGARRLVRDSDADALTGGERALVEECARRMGMDGFANGPEPGRVTGRGMGPEVRVVDDADALAGPVVVGARRPVLLCPEGFVRGLLEAGREDEATAALCHEMAHIRRRDYAMNLVCEAMAVPLKWHPVTYGVERWIRGTREMACDAMAAQAMESDAEYARCLVGLAERMTTGGLAERAGAMGLWSGNALEERVMRLMETGKAMSARAKAVRGAAGVAAMAAAVALAGMVHVVPARAQAAARDSVPQVSEARPGASAPAAAPTGAGPKAGVVAPHVLSVKPKGMAPVVVVPPIAKVSAVIAAPKVGVIAPVMALNIAPVQPKIAAAPVISGVLAPVIAVAPIVAGPALQTTPVPPSEPAPNAQAAPETQVKPMPAPKAVKSHHHEAIVSRDGKLYVWENGKERELTPAERARLEKKLEDAQKKIAAETARINSPEFREQIEKAERDASEAERKIQSGEIQRQLAEAQRRLNSPEFKERITEAQKKAMADVQRELNSPEFKERMAEAQKRADEAMAKLQSPEFKKQMEEAQQKALNNADAQMAEARKQLAAEMTKFNSPEFKAQMEKAQRQAMEAQRKIINGEIQKQMAGAQKELQKELDALKAADGK